MPGPLELFQAEQRGKLTKFLSDRPVIGTSANPGLLDSYFAGRNLTMSGGEIGMGGADARLAKIRRRGAYAAGGLMAANTLGLDPFGATSAANNLAMLGAHGAVGHSMWRMGGKGRIAGIGYLAAAGVNTFRSGDNTGPM